MRRVGTKDKLLQPEMVFNSDYNLYTKVIDTVNKNAGVYSITSNSVAESAFNISRSETPNVMSPMQSSNINNKRSGFLVATSSSPSHGVKSGCEQCTNESFDVVSLFLRLCSETNVFKPLSKELGLTDTEFMHIGHRYT